MVFLESWRIEATDQAVHLSQAFGSCSAEKRWTVANTNSLKTFPLKVQKQLFSSLCIWNIFLSKHKNVVGVGGDGERPGVRLKEQGQVSGRLSSLPTAWQPCATVATLGVIKGEQENTGS